MNGLSKTGKTAILVAVAAIAIVFVVIFGSRSSRPSQYGASGSPTSSPTANPAPQAGTTPGNPRQAPAPVHVSPFSPIALVSPTAGQNWQITTQNNIQWSRAPGVTGQIDLLDATTYQLVGVILNQIGPNQTSYTWNTRDILLSRTNPSKVTVTPGRYVIRISFDGNRLPSATSPLITLTPAPPSIN